MAVPTFHADLLDLLLDELQTTVETLYLCSAEPTSFAEASSTYKVGTKSGPVLSVPEDSGVNGGRKITVSQIVDGTSNATATATHLALTDDSASKLLVVQALGASQQLLSGNEFLLDSFIIENRPVESS